MSNPTSFWQNEFTPWYIKIKLFIQETKFTFHKQCLFGLLFSRNAEKTYTDQSKLQVVLLFLKRSELETLKCSSCKKIFFSTFFFHFFSVISATYFDECFMWQLEDIIFYKSLSLLRRFFQLPCCYFLFSKCLQY